MQLVCTTDCGLVTSLSSAVCSHSPTASTNHCVTVQQKAATTTGIDAGFLQEVSANICSTYQLLLRKTEQSRRGRIEWMKLRSCRWWDQARLVWNDGEWKKNFRMTKTTFLRLCADLCLVIAFCTLTSFLTFCCDW